MRALTNSLHLDDYKDMEEDVKELKIMFDKFVAQGNLWVVIGNEHRYWEYGTVMMLLIDYCKGNMDELKYLDVGSGWSLIGPAMAYIYNMNVTECEPSPREFNDRITMNAYLQAEGKKQIRVLQQGLDNLPDEQFDLVSCISVIEHLPADVEIRCWKNLVDRVKPGGILFVDCDVVPDNTKSYMFDNLRTHNFTIPEIQDRVKLLKSLGMESLTEEDYTWNGAHVYDYSFFRICMRREQ